MHYLDEQNGYERVVFVGQGPGALLALLAAALLPKARGAALLETQLSFDALFEADYYFAPETAFETGLLRLCDLPDLAKLAGRVCAFTPKNPAAVAGPTYAHAYSGALGKGRPERGGRVVGG